jgi:hypothetical protein
MFEFFSVDDLATGIAEVEVDGSGNSATRTNRLIIEGRELSAVQIERDPIFLWQGQV